MLISDNYLWQHLHSRPIDSQEAAALFTFSGRDEAPCHASNNLQAARRHLDDFQPLNPFQPLRATHSEERLLTLQQSAAQQDVVAQMEGAPAGMSWHAAHNHSIRRSPEICSYR